MALDVLIIIGGSRGIGKFFLDSNYSIARDILVIGTSNINFDYLKHSNGTITYIQLDITNFKLSKKIICEWLSNKKTNKMGLVCSSAILGKPGGIFDVPIEDYQKVLDTNLLGHLNVIQSLLPIIVSGSSINIVMFAGGGAAYGYPEFFSYSISKVALVRAVENLHIEFNNRGCDVNIIALAPGAVETDMLKVVMAAGGIVKTKTEIQEPSNFIKQFLLNKFENSKLSGRFIHVRDDLDKLDNHPNFFMLRRIE